MQSSGDSLHNSLLHRAGQSLFTLANAYFLSSQDIVLALDETLNSDFFLDGPLEVEPGWLSLKECQLYNKQMFYWQVVRNGPSIFPPDAELFCGLPKHITQLN